MKFDREKIEQLSWNDPGDTSGPVGYEVVVNDMVDTRRWSVRHKLVFKAPNGKYYKTYYETGATEYQEYDHWDDWEPECQEVQAVEKMVIVYE